jgi:hypothetical protein
MSAGARRDERSGQGDERARLPPGRATTRVQEWVADLGAPVALPHAAVPLLRPRHYVRPTAVLSIKSNLQSASARVLYTAFYQCLRRKGRAACARLAGEGSPVLAGHEPGYK